MKMFCFVSKNDPTQQPIGTVQANTLDEAIRSFAQMKMLSVEDFLTIFSVKGFTYETAVNESTRTLLKG